MRFSAWLFAVMVCAGSVYGAGELSGRRAPGFSLPDSSFQQHDPQDHYGKVVVVEIMQTDCPHCRLFSKILGEVRIKYAGRVAVFSIVNPPDTQASVAKYLAETKAAVPILFDCGQVAASYLKVTPQNPSISVPHVFLIDGQGMIRNDFGYGPATKEFFEGRAIFAEIEKLLTGAKKK